MRRERKKERERERERKEERKEGRKEGRKGGREGGRERAGKYKYLGNSLLGYFGDLRSVTSGNLDIAPWAVNFLIFKNEVICC